MEWSNLNQQMIEEFFQNSSSPTNAQISLNFTITSREMCSNNKEKKQISPRLQTFNQLLQKPVNPESDILGFANKQIMNFSTWHENVQYAKQKYSQGIEAQIQQIQSHIATHLTSPFKAVSTQQKHLQDKILSQLAQLSTKITQPIKSPKTCQNCLTISKKLTELTSHLTVVQTTLQAKTQQLEEVNKMQVKRLGSDMAFQVEIKVLNEKVARLISQNSELVELLKAKNQQVNKFSEEITRYNFQRSNFLSQTKSLQNRLHQMQKSKSLLMSAAKNSTSHSEFNITTSNNTNTTLLKSSQNQTHIDTTLIHTNQFSSSSNGDNSKLTVDDYIQWFQKLKQLFLQKYKKEERDYLKKFPELKNNEVALKEVTNNFRKGHVRYEIARSWKNITDYVNKNKEKFMELIGSEIVGPIIKMGSEGSTSMIGKETTKMIEDLEEQVKKSQKKTQGHLEQIKNLNQQLTNLKKIILKEKQENSKLSNEVNQLQQQVEQLHQQLSYSQHQFHQATSKPQNIQFQCPQLIHQLEKNLSEIQIRLQQKSEQLKQVIYESQCHQQAQIKLNQALKECERLLHKERVEKIKYFKESMPTQCLTTACRIRLKNVNEKKMTSIVHQFEGRAYVEKEKMSYKFDIVEQTGKTPTDQIYLYAKKILFNCFYEPSSSLLLSMGSVDSEFKEYFRGDNGMLWNFVSEIFKLQFNQKKFLQIDVSFNVIEMTNSQIIDLMDTDMRKKVSIRRQTNSNKIILQNCLKASSQTQQEAKSVLTQAFSKQRELNTHIITIMQLNITNKRSKQKYTSKLFFAQVGLQNSIGQNDFTLEPLAKDSKAIWNVFNSINFKQPYQPESNRLTYLLSQCFTQNSRNLMIINVSPTDYHRQHSLFSLNYGSTLKYLASQKPQSLIRFTQKTPSHSVSKLQHNQSHSLIQTPTLNCYQGEFVEEKPRSITKHRNSSSEHMILASKEVGERKKRTISRLSIC